MNCVRPRWRWRHRLTLAGAVLAVSLLGATGATALAAGRAATQTLTMSSSLSCAAIDVLTAAGASDNDMYQNLAYESFVRVLAGGRGDPSTPTVYGPGTATAWTVSNANKVVTLTLRKGVHYSDGTLMTAATVKDWLDYVQGGATPIINVLGLVRSVDVKSTYVLTITLKSPNPDVLYFLSNEGNLGGPVSPQVVDQYKANPGSRLLSGETDGTGPYVLDPTQTVLSDHCTYLPNKYYYDQSAIKWATVVTKDIGDANTTLAAFQAGQDDVALGAFSTLAAARQAGVAVYEEDGFTHMMALLAHGAVSPALGDVRVRQALNYALDRKTIMKALYGEAGLPSSSSQPLSLGADRNYLNYYGYDPAKAKTLLAAAGYPNGFTIRVLTLGLTLFNFQPLAQAACQDWAAIGVTCDLHASLATYAGDLAGGTFDAISVVSGLTTPWLWYSQAFSPKPPFQEYADQHGWHDSAIAKLWLKAERLPASKAAPLWTQMMDQSIKDAVMVPFGGERLIRYVSKRVVLTVKKAHPKAKVQPANINGIWNYLPTTG